MLNILAIQDTPNLLNWLKRFLYYISVSYISEKCVLSNQIYNDVRELVLSVRTTPVVIVIALMYEYMHSAKLSCVETLSS